MIKSLDRSKGPLDWSNGFINVCIRLLDRSKCALDRSKGLLCFLCKKVNFKMVGFLKLRV